MRTCRHCGCYLPDGATICLACGTYQGKRLPDSTHTDPDLIETCALGDVLVELRASPVIEGISIFDNNGCSIRGRSACAYREYRDEIEELEKRISELESELDEI